MNWKWGGFEYEYCIRRMCLYSLHLSKESYFANIMKDKSRLKVALKWSSFDKALLPALSGVVKTIF
jgi:hypothetical protein